jgi:hypothetical protein
VGCPGQSQWKRERMFPCSSGSHWMRAHYTGGKPTGAIGAVAVRLVAVGAVAVRLVAVISSSVCSVLLLCFFHSGTLDG